MNVRTSTLECVHHLSAGVMGFASSSFYSRAMHTKHRNVACQRSINIYPEMLANEIVLFSPF